MSDETIPDAPIDEDRVAEKNARAVGIGGAL